MYSPMLLHSKQSTTQPYREACCFMYYTTSYFLYPQRALRELGTVPPRELGTVPLLGGHSWSTEKIFRILV